MRHQITLACCSESANTRLIELGRNMRFLIITVLLFSIAGCSNSSKVSLLSSSSLPPKEQAFVTPPPGGPAVLGIVQTGFSNGVQQDITLANNSRTQGQNLLRVQLIGVKNKGQENSGRLSDAVPDLEDISSEIREFLPGVTVKRSPYLLQNIYGPFSYAAGRTVSGDICLYAWQRLGYQISKQTIFSPRGAIQIRLRLCDSKKSEQELLQNMYSFSINVAILDPSWDPYLMPPNPPSDWGRSGYRISPQTREGFVGVVPARQVPVRSVPRATQQVRQPAPGPTITPAPSASVIVPPPPSAPVVVPRPAQKVRIIDNSTSNGS
ncbi:cellulose biosynthesis protein BcsN [Roseibium sp. RKSG952]|uniref:cellulose biosynthesis protein BcsN n=1 Tax=Roseibium sp. RKSG952 TaxID=2529384 RepID=UPI0012BBC5E7|nr:cellulose biosynthesis protein BcsN [Roseibium sp. RKSG952]MTH99307.1 cellulose biosynthesis protein BcsN [Roseibium sp. RKSG952]